MSAPAAQPCIYCSEPLGSMTVGTGIGDRYAHLVCHVRENPHGPPDPQPDAEIKVHSTVRLKPSTIALVKARAFIEGKPYSTMLREIIERGAVAPFPDRV
jgi:hypothetical protein